MNYAAIGYESYQDPRLQAPAGFFGEDEADDIRDELIEQYRAAAIAQMHAELDEEELATVTEENIAEWALDLAEADGQTVQRILNFRRSFMFD